MLIQRPVHQWVIKDLDTRDNTTSLLNSGTKKYAGLNQAAGVNTEIVLVDEPTRFQLVPYSTRNPQYGFQSVSFLEIFGI